MNNLLSRTLTGILYIALIISSIIFSFNLFAFTISAFCLIGLSEFYKLTNDGEIKTQKYFCYIIGLITLAPVIISHNFYIPLVALAKIYLCLFPVILLLFISELYRKKNKPFHNLAFSILGLVYIVLPFTMLLYLYIFLSRNNSIPYIVLYIFIMVWLNDTGAYIFGSLFGKRKLFERISPKKSWAGFIGGCISTTLFTIVFSLYFDKTYHYHLIVISVIVVITSTFGDLAESLLKRSFNIKDSGNILPGHGGILDRFDSILFSIPFIFSYLLIFY